MPAYSSTITRRVSKSPYVYVIREKGKARPRYLGVNDEGQLTWWVEELRAKPFRDEDDAYEWANDRLSERFEVIKQGLH